jgi:hypothetical protein
LFDLEPSLSPLFVVLAEFDGCVVLAEFDGFVALEQYEYIEAKPYIL